MDHIDGMDDEAVALHDRQVQAVMNAVAKLTTNLAPQHFTPEAVFEGAVKGGAAALLALRDDKPEEIADLLEAFAVEFRNLGRPNLHVVQ